MESDVRLLQAEPHFTREPARTPMKFGGVVMTDALLCHVRAVVENRRCVRAEGWGAIFLADQWAWPQVAAGHTVAESLMRDLVVDWCRLAESDSEFRHPIDFFQEREAELQPAADRVCQAAGLTESMPRMAALISAAPLDAAVHDAFGHANRIDVYDGYGPEHMSHDLSRWLGGDFRGRYVADFLHPLRRTVDAFHLVGGLDPLTEAEQTDDAPDDGLPVTLEQWIRAERLHCLKVKLCGTDPEADLDRLQAVVAVARGEHRRLGIEDLWLTLDPNEMCDTPDVMTELLRRFRERDPRGFDSVLYVEQPCERDLNRRRLDVRELAMLTPVIADEALGGLDDLHTALELGYSGAALKSCKCQSEQLIMAALLTERGLPFSVQDLANPGIALLHSVGLAGRLQTIHGVESNSRQFFPSASNPERRVHPGVFRLTNGRIDTRSLSGNGLGYRWNEIGRRFDDPADGTA